MTTQRPETNQKSQNQKSEKGFINLVLVLGDRIARLQHPVVRSLIHEFLNWVRRVYFQTVVETNRNFASRLRDLLNKTKSSSDGKDSEK